MEVVFFFSAGFRVGRGWTTAQSPKDKKAPEAPRYFLLHRFGY